MLLRCVERERGNRSADPRATVCKRLHPSPSAGSGYSPLASRPVNQMKNRMQALGLLVRSFKAATDDELTAAIEALDDDHREGLQSFVDELTPAGIRTAVKAGRI